MLAVKNSQSSGVVKQPMTAKGVHVNVNTQEYTHVDAFLAAAHRRKYPAKSTLIYPGDKSDSIYYILEGSITVLVNDEWGREIIVAYLYQGDFFGEMPLFVDDRPRSAWVKAKTGCEVAELSYNKFKELAEAHPELLYALGRQMAERMQHTTQKVSDLALVDVTGRVARTLLDLTKQPDAITHPNGMQIKITRQRLAVSSHARGRWWVAS